MNSNTPLNLSKTPTALPAKKKKTTLSKKRPLPNIERVLGSSNEARVPPRPTKKARAEVLAAGAHRPPAQEISEHSAVIRSLQAQLAAAEERRLSLVQGAKEAMGKTAARKKVQRRIDEELDGEDEEEETLGVFATQGV